MKVSKEVIVRDILDSIRAYSKKDQKEILSLLLKEVSAETKTFDIPISAFRSKLSGLEIVVKFLKEESKLSFKRIAGLLNRKPNTIWTTYNNAIRKYPQKLDTSDYSCSIPASVFRDRKYSILELIVAHLKEHYDLSIKEIAGLLGRNYQTIRTAYSRYRTKRGRK